jgi:hypothetical protein
MHPTWTEEADNILGLMQQVTSGKVFPEGSPEKEFYRAVWTLCQQVKGLDDDSGGFTPRRSIMS